MSFDGLPRAAQAMPYSNSLNPYIGANQAQTLRRGKPSVDKNRQAFSSDDSERALPQESGLSEHGGDPLTEDEREQVLKFARLRGVLNFSLAHDGLYQFTYNEQTQQVELVDMTGGSHQVLLTLTIDELLQMSQRIERFAGLITSRQA